jgi:putative endonuclease
MRYFVYILLCQDGSFYTGYTKNLDKRILLHVNGRGARYTKMHSPIRIAHVEEFSTRSEAMKRERVIKKLNHQQKSDLSIKDKSLEDSSNANLKK